MFYLGGNHNGIDSVYYDDNTRNSLEIILMKWPFRRSLLKNHALTHVYATIQKFEIENRPFEQKYGCTFHEFRQRVESQENEEHFQQEDALVDWEFTIENLTLWIKCKEECEAE